MTKASSVAERWTGSIFDPSNTHDLHRLRWLLVTFSYRPGWTFTLNEEIATLEVRTEAIDTDDHSRTIIVCFSFPVPSYPPRHFDWQRWLLESVVMKIERHEAQEFFKVNGVKVFDPHANGSNAI